MNSAEPWVRVLDKLDAIDNRLRLVELDVREVKTQQDAARSRISRETAAATEADESLSARVKALELAQANAGGESKGISKVAAIFALVAAGGTGAAFEAVAKALAGV